MITKEKKWLAKNCPNADRNYYEPEGDKQYIYCKKFKAKCKPTNNCILKYYNPTFKTKEELLSEQTGIKSYGQGLDDAFKSFAERVNFYNEYFHKPGLLRYDYPDLFKKYDKEKVDKTMYSYNIWLSDFCFGDVIE